MVTRQFETNPKEAIAGITNVLTAIVEVLGERNIISMSEFGGSMRRRLDTGHYGDGQGRGYLIAFTEALEAAVREGEPTRFTIIDGGRDEGEDQ